MPTPVLYRKWRPQTLSDVVGQEHVTRTLLNALAAGRVAHAYLFCGPRGTGKTSTARILAKAVNCLQNGQGEPCDACTMCAAIADGRAMDLVEIDAASNRGIDSIRDLKEKVNFSPGEARYKVYVVDEVHMLTIEAFNALLKTLEEPPPFTIFVLATTEVHRVPVTIVSRCQRFDFHRLSVKDLTTYLQRICRGEGIQTDVDALTLLARCANGGARDAVNLLEQVEVASQGQVTVEAVEHVLGLASNPLAVEVVQAIAAASLPQGLGAIQLAREEGSNLAQFGKEVTDCLRGLLLIKAGVSEAIDLPTDMIASLSTISKNLSMEQVSRAVHAFSRLDFRGAEGSSLPLELALLDALEAEPVPAAASTAAPPTPARQQTETALPTPARPSPQPARATREPAKPVPQQRVPVQTGVPSRSAPAQPAAQSVPDAERAQAVASAETAPVVSPAATASEPEPAAAQPSPPPAPQAVTDSELERIRQLFTNKEAHIPQLRFLEGILQACVVERIEENTIVLSFRPAMAVHKKRLEDNVRLAEAAIKEATGTPYRIRCILGDAAPNPPTAGSSGHLVQAALNAGARRAAPPS